MRTSTHTHTQSNKNNRWFSAFQYFNIINNEKKKRTLTIQTMFHIPIQNYTLSESVRHLVSIFCCYLFFFCFVSKTFNMLSFQSQCQLPQNCTSGNFHHLQESLIYVFTVITTKKKKKKNALTP